MTVSGRINYEPSSKYGNKTYLGNWTEERCRYVKEKHDHISVYQQDYLPKPNSKIDNDTMWDSIFQGAGHGDHILFYHNGDNYQKNFSTTYDLSYNHFPSIRKTNPVYRSWRFLAGRWEPEEDLTQNYGNITDYGLTAYKKQVWEGQKSDPRVTSTTEYEDSYIPPSDKDRKFKRWAIPIKNSSLLHRNNIVMQQLQLRNKPMFNVTPNEELVTVFRERRCNPITWECYGNIPKESRRLTK